MVRNSRFYVLLLVLSCLCCFSRASAQFGLQVSALAPVGTSAYLFKPAPGFELVFNTGDMDEKLRFQMSIGFHSFRPTQDTFRTITVESGGANALLPGYEVVKSYLVVPIGFGAEYRFLNTRFSPVVGLHGYFHVIDYVRDYDDGVINGTGDENVDWQLCLVPKIGLSYKLSDNWYLQGGVSYSLGIVGTVDTQNYFKTFISITHFTE